MQDAASPTTEEETGPRAKDVLGVIESLLRESRGGEPTAVALDDALEDDLGVDSLTRTELMLRLEQAFGVRMEEAAVLSAATARDLLRILRCAPARAASSTPARSFVPAAAGGAAELPGRAQTLIDVLRWHAARGPDATHVRLLGEQGGELEITCAGLLARATLVAGELQRRGLLPGDTAALMLPTSRGLLEAFIGIQLAGGIPVPLYPPWRPAQIEDHLRRQANILANASARMLITDERAWTAARILRAGAPSMQAVITVEQLESNVARAHPVDRRSSDVALIQYTSGSTGQPKGVVLTHANLLANIRAMGRVLQVTSGDVFVSWLPMYHDMGLIGAWLGSLYHGIPLVLMSPQAFLGRPSRWLQAISEHRGTLTAAPNFAYELLATRVPDDELGNIELGSLRATLNGSEPVHATTLERFCERFGRKGFRREAMMPVYGLAECGVGLAFPVPGRAPRVDVIDRRALRERGRAEAVVAADDSAALRVVSCGMALPGHEIRVVDEHREESPDRHEGRIEFRGPSATSGYFRQADATRLLFDGDWLDTGDVGYVADGEVFLTSRAKDLIKRGGHNLHPYDLEVEVGALQGIRRGCVAVFGASDPHWASERIVVVAESRLTAPDAVRALRAKIAALALALLGTPVDDIVIAAPHTVLKTSSGKIRRAACRELYEQGLLTRDPRSVAWQLLRLWTQSAQRRMGSPLRRLRDAAIGAWLWTAFGAAAFVGAAVALLPALVLRKRLARSVARAGLWLSDLPVSVTTEHVPPAGPCVFVANHASYVDWLVLIATLPSDVCFVAKRELAATRCLGWLLGRMGVQFVEREDTAASVEGARALVEVVRAGTRLLYFPEGTLTRAPGLRPFHMGGFIAAAQCGVSVVPVSLRGTRSVMRDGSWWPRRGRIDVHICTPLQPRGAAWDDAVQLRDASRAVISGRAAEPSLPL